MSVLIYAEHHNGKFPKSALEAVSYGADVATMMGTEAIVITTGNLQGDGGLGNAGASKVLVAAVQSTSDSQQMTRLVTAAAAQVGANTVIFSHDIAGKMIAPRVAAKMDAGLVPGATALPSADFVIRKNVFSGKAIAEVAIQTANKVITVLPNSLGVKNTGSTAAVEPFSADLGAMRITVKEVKSENKDGEVPLPEAELVVSAGRGMKGPEHWGPIEELAKVLGATTACSRPVADIGWRPHHEHVGQTGVTIRPNLYIAVGISGAIQHLAGVNGSKTIVVINKDPEAPFFKAADYGIVGDAFEVLPKIIEAAKAFKAAH
ncbi:MAG: electron transfer flavoprotein subunit alpha/FixB family protein [Flavobacteriales bacterium]|jgi:electron transfer flavoprotein alpha subunit